MSTELGSKLTGEVISVSHSAESCRITIELKGSPSQTAAVMKQSLAEFGIAEGTPVCAQVDSSQVLVEVVQQDNALCAADSR
jgi:molybdopterin-binding protein